MAVLCKSCRIFHSEPKKIGFVFFCFLYYFLRILQDSTPPPRSRRDIFTNRPSNFADRPSGRKFRLHGSSIPARGRLGSTGKEWGSAQGLTYDRFRGLDGSEACRRGGSAAPASGGRCDWSSGEQDARPGTQATWGALGVQ
jgi:hypothetical protein